VSGDWASVSAELIPVALVVALSPISVLPALLLVLYSTRPRATSLTFLTGWLVGLVVSTVVFVNVPKLLGDRAGGLGGSQFGLRVTFGVVLILTGVVLWLRRAHTARTGWLDRGGHGLVHRHRRARPGVRHRQSEDPGGLCRSGFGDRYLRARPRWMGVRRCVLRGAGGLDDGAAGSWRTWLPPSASIGRWNGCGSGFSVARTRSARSRW
jgi:hypothetical protein